MSYIIENSFNIDFIIKMKAAADSETINIYWI